MNREIKFRAWSKKWKEMSYFELYPNPQPSLIDDFYFFSDELIPMQFTGLHDKNGKEIYEGDVVKYGKEIGEVKFGLYEFNDMYDCGSQEVLGFYVDGRYYRDDNSFFDSKSNLSEWYEIIGNIYENPDLINNQK